MFPTRPQAVRLLVVALDDALAAQLDPPVRPIALPGGTALRYVPASQLDAAEQADVLVREYQPSRPGRTLLFDTIARDRCTVERFEQDPAGVIYRDSVALWDSAPVAFGASRSRRYGRLALGQEAGLFFLSRTDDGWTMQILNTQPVLVLLHVPEVRPTAVIPALWLDLAARALDGANWEMGADAPA
jgi:hypothetical protein